MITGTIASKDKERYNEIITHPLQAWEWGEFREKTGITIIRRGVFNNDRLTNGFQLTIHPIPHTPWTIGYLPKGEIPTKEVLEELTIIGKKNNCIFIQLEPNIQVQGARDKVQALVQCSKFKVQSSTHPLFTKYTFILDLTKSEEDLLKNMHPKTRYNIKIAKKHNVEVKEDNSQKAFERYWELTQNTTKRQKFYAHTKKYHTLQWETLSHKITDNNLTSHLFTAVYQGKILTTMLFFVFHDTLYYPYGASSNESRNVMHSTLTMWEAILWGKKHGFKAIDMWGALGPNPNINDPWIGFHTFKERFNPKHVEHIGSYDLIINPLLYQLYKAADKLRWLYLKLKR